MKNGRPVFKPYPTWALSNNSAEIRRVKERIKSLSQQREIGYVGWEFEGGKVEANAEANRLQILFEEKPDAATREELKSNGFRWSPKAEAWQRQLTDNTVPQTTSNPFCPFPGKSPQSFYGRISGSKNRLHRRHPRRSRFTRYTQTRAATAGKTFAFYRHISRRRTGKRRSGTYCISVRRRSAAS